MKKTYKRVLCCLVALITLAIPILVLAQFAQLNVGDIVGISGPPSRVAMNQGKRRVHHSENSYAREAKIWEGRAQQYRDRTRQQLAQAASQIHKTRQIVASRPPGKKHSVKIAKTVINIPYQNLILDFVNPKQASIAGLHIVATVHPKTGPDVIINDQVTDDTGHIKLAKVGPLPVSIDLAIAPASSDQSDSAPDWQFVNVRDASLIIPHAQGAKIATIASLPYLVASTKPMATTRRAIIYQYQQPNPLVVERTVADVDIKAPAGSVVTSAALGEQQITVPETGHVACRFPLSTLEDGPVPIRVASKLPAGEAEAVIKSYTYDPYQLNIATSPDLQLARITNVDLTGSIGVLQPQSQVVQSFGDIEKNKHLGNAVAQNDGSEIWSYSQQGIAVNMRPSPFKVGRDDPAVIESIRLTSAVGGSIGGITVGSSADDVLHAFGKPQSETINFTEPGKTENYLDQGIRICEINGHVAWIEVTRPTSLLTEGTTAFVPRNAARLFVEKFNGDARTSIATIDQLTAYLGKLPSIHLVDSKADADLVLDASVTDFQSHKDQVVDGLPFKYSCSTALSYSLYDQDASQYAAEDKQVAASAGADYTTEALIGGGIAGILLSNKSDVAKIAGTLLGGVGIVQLNKSIQRAANRCPGIASRTVFGDMVQDINKASDFSVRVTSIDYDTGRMRLNVGTDNGIHISTPENPCEFEVMVDGQPLPDVESGNSADYYSAVVVEADENSCQCELHHIQRKVKRSSEKTTDDINVDMVRHIPNPATGIVSARASVHFASLPVITDADLQAASEQADREAQAQNAQEQQREQADQQRRNQNNHSNGADASGDPITSLLNKVFGNKKKK